MWAQMRVVVGQSGRRINVNDLWIAATAAVHGMPVCTQDDDFDVLEILESQDSAVGKDQPLAALEQGQAMGAIEEALAKLPARQREAFLLRYWEDMDTAETAAAMGCSEGSVKTHCSRAVHALQGLLRQKGITL